MEGTLGRNPSRRDSLSALFEARSVAVVGVSDDPRKQGRVVLRNLLNAGFDGRVYGVSRSMKEIDGVPCVESPGALPEPVDVAFLALPAEASVGAVRELATAGARVAIIGAAGFAENGDDAGLARQAELTRISAETGIRIVGPNCNGIYNANAGLSIGFNTAHSKRLPAGSVAILSHSGAMFDAMVGQLTRLGAGLSIFASSGNEADLDLLEYIDYAIDEPNTKVIALLLDSLSDGERFRHLADKAEQANKSIVALQVGKSEIGARAAVAHSSRLSGSAKAYAALFEASGVPAVTSIEALMTAAAMLSFYGRRSGELAALSSSGAGASLLADLAECHNVPLATLAPGTSEEITRLARFSHTGNPADLGIFAGVPGRETVPWLIVGDPSVGAAMALVQSFPLGAHPTLASFAQARATFPKPFVVVAPGGLSDEEHDRYVRGGLRVFSETEPVIQAMGALLMPRRRFTMRAPNAKNFLVTTEPLLHLGRQLTEPESLELLGRFGIDVVASETCAGPDEAADAAERLGWPVVMKAVVEGVAHKSEHNLVRVGIDDTTALQAAYTSFGKPAKVIVQKMISGKLEAIAGVTRVPGVGRVLIAGLGGIHAEALDAAILWPLPTTRDEIVRKLADSSLGRVLSSARWTDAKSRLALIDALLALQDFALWAGDRVAAVDINPLILGNGRAVAVDALVLPAGLD